MPQMAHHLNVNVLNRETLIDAYEHPEQVPQPDHPGVRLCGELPQALPGAAAGGHRPHLPRDAVTRRRHDGSVHSIQSLGAVDGPGLRCVVFLQGCPLRCAYCHNPDTWDFSGGTEIDPAGAGPKEMLPLPALLPGKGRRHPHRGRAPGPGPLCGGGVPPAAGPEGVHTALDTSCMGDLDAAARVLAHTSLDAGGREVRSPGRITAGTAAARLDTEYGTLLLRG